MASIRKRPRKDGTATWAVLWRDADTGKQTSRSLATEADAKMLKDFLDANNNSFAQAAQAAAKLKSEAPTVAEIVSTHIETLTAVSPGTRRTYRSQARIHINPTIGLIPVDTLTRADVAQWFNQLNVKAKSKKNIHAILSAALKTAIDDGHISKNVALGIRAAREENTFDPVFLTESQMSIIYSALPQQWRLFIEFLENTGLRYGEATALRWSDVDLTGERAIVKVTRAWRRGEDGEYVGPPKTRKSVRSVSLPLWLSQKLKVAREDAPADQLIFQRPSGLHLSNSYFHLNVWMPLMKEISHQLGCKPRIHDLRHTHASRLIAKGVSLPVIQARLGHESITTTVNTYGHLTNDADSLAASLLD